MPVLLAFHILGINYFRAGQSSLNKLASDSIPSDNAADMPASADALPWDPLLGKQVVTEGTDSMVASPPRLSQRMERLMQKARQGIASGCTGRCRSIMRFGNQGQEFPDRRGEAHSKSCVHRRGAPPLAIAGESRSQSD